MSSRHEQAVRDQYSARRRAPIRFVRQIYLILIPLTIGFMMLHNGGDWIRKVYRTRVRPLAQEYFIAHMPAKPEVRMYGLERLQHILLLTSFFTLTWTGFALKFPDASWAWPLVAWETKYPVRGVVHRVAAIVFMSVAVMHVLTLVFSRRLRDHWKHLLPRFRDLPDTIHSFAYNVGLTNRPPRLPSYNFAEKMEYWAVVWGAVIMGLTGIMLWANTFFLKYLPKILLDVATTIHLYEAILAALAILVWHIYFVILDPEVYPIDTTWLTGKSIRPHHEAGVEGRRSEQHEPGEAPAS
jgi:formate dehydrogenase gamma subunit